MSIIGKIIFTISISFFIWGIIAFGYYKLTSDEKWKQNSIAGFGGSLLIPTMIFIIIKLVSI